MDVNTLDVLHITTLEDREQLLSAIYNELHPPTTITQRIDSLLGTLYHYVTNKHSLGQFANEVKEMLTGISFLSFSTESLGPNNIEMFTAKLVSMSKSKSSPHVSCLSMNRRSLKLRYRLSYVVYNEHQQTKQAFDLFAFFHDRNSSQNGTIQRNSQLIEITINGESVNWLTRWTIWYIL